MENYGDMGRDRYNMEAAAIKLKIISDYAIKSRKLTAFTETGMESIPDTTWWTNTLLKAMQMHKSRLAYILVWRNDRRSPTHYYTLFPGHKSVPDFMEFYNNTYSPFENDLKNTYRRKRWK